MPRVPGTQIPPEIKMQPLAFFGSLLHEQIEENFMPQKKVKTPQQGQCMKILKNGQNMANFDYLKI